MTSSSSTQLGSTARKSRLGGHGSRGFNRAPAEFGQRPRCAFILAGCACPICDGVISRPV
jgi:hypothetical protein